ncbi:hypothetical protein [Aureimonas jatrophae]|uniref:Uncharacterized protein n=1 Tax=Aureimonas jatrophae TaxID=1166073 RepID=A0A1H0JEL9_9HYPH|nr:hypothetical protein [Aureimonas jatrophae]MBB3951452.1 2'-5' RNA ligase [Aureimonas jatrophae]SDO41990.1 hypothetical protein SAMN05192530_106143 [Aureimonas jatrophae]
MTSWLTDLVLIAALCITSWRVGAMYKELQRLRSGEAGFKVALEEADASINRAANAVVLLKSEGLRTLRALEERIAEANELGERLEVVLESYERARHAAPAVAEETRSRLASVPSANR